jgi:hypothetical protein
VWSYYADLQFIREDWVEEKSGGFIKKKGGAGLFYLINLPPFLICEF